MIEFDQNFDLFLYKYLNNNNSHQIKQSRLVQKSLKKGGELLKLNIKHL